MRPSRATTSLPWAARLVDSSIIDELSRAASPLRLASARTASPTTEKPLPASPARAASALPPVRSDTSVIRRAMSSRPRDCSVASAAMLLLASATWRVPASSSSADGRPWQ